MKTKKLLALILSLVLVIGLLPVTALADGPFLQLTIDLTNYHGEVTVSKSENFTFSGGNTLVAGEKNILSIGSDVGNSKNVSLLFSLLGFESDTHKCWRIEGTLGNGDNVEGYIDYDATNFDDASIKEIWIKNNPQEGSYRIRITKNEFEFVRGRKSAVKTNWGEGTRLTFTPIYAYKGDFQAVAESNNDTWGSASFSGSGVSNGAIFTATPKDGYAFDYWMKNGNHTQITDNPYTVTLDADATYTAYFRERYAVSAMPSNETQGQAMAIFTGTVEGADTYRLLATPSMYAIFDKWTCGEQEYTNNPLDIAVTESGATYTAQFKPVELTLGDEAILYPYGDTTSDIRAVNMEYQSKFLSEGQRAALNIPISLSKQITDAANNVTFQVCVTDADENTVTQCEVIPNASVNKTEKINISINPAKKEYTTLTATVTMTTPAGSSTATKTYSGFTIAESAENNDFHYLTSPSASYGDVSIEDIGPNISGIYARVDSTTKAVSLYLYGDRGIYQFDPGTEPNLAVMDGLANQNILGIGPDGSSGLKAVVHFSDGYGRIGIYEWNGESWASVSGTNLELDASDGQYSALVVSSDDIWTNTKHWNGDSWADHSKAFSTFERVSDTEAYAVDRNGNRWKYDGNDWSVTASEAPDISSVTSKSVDNDKVAIGQDQNGDWYLFLPGDGHFIDNSGWYSYTGSDVFKWDKSNSKWVYQLMSDFDDPQDDPITESVRRIRPDGVNGISSPAPGISVMYGAGSASGRGSIYLSTDNVTVTFDPGEGRILGDAALTAPILSEIDVSKVPGALLAGRDFGGWFYDAAYTIAFDTNGVMPGANVTVYAKWTEKEGLTDELGFYRQRALASLEQQYKKYSSANYSAENWTALQAAYEDGKTAINSAAVGTDRVDENINAALTAATEAMAAIPKLEKPQKRDITVAVSMDANTLGLGYLIEPTLVTVEEGTQASVVITDLIKQMAAEKYGVTREGYTTYHESEPAAAYPWMMTGSVTSDFYLAQVYYPEQQNYKLPDFLETAVTGTGFDDSDKYGNYLGEFDYTYTSGWTYSIGDRSGGAQFPGVGASGWNLSDGEVMRWQFTLVGYGSDLNADNTQWGAQSLIPTLGDKSALTWKVAEINEAGTKNTYGDDYDKAIAVLTEAEATQKQVDDALAALNKQDGGNASAGGTGKKDKTYKITVAATENGAATVSASTASEGEKITVTAKPAEGYELDSITVKGEKAGSVEVKDGAFIMPADDVTITVKFKKAEGKKTTAERPFTDVNEGDWFYDAVYFCFDKGYFKGTGETAFEPQGTMTRAMFATVLWRIAGEPAPKGGKSFGDVGAGQWFTDAVLWASGEGILDGYGGGSFGTNDPVTREQIATILYRYVKTLGLEVGGSADLGKYPDGGATSPWAKDAMQWAVSAGLFRGDDAGALNPGGEATRAQVATLLQRLVGLIVK